MENSIINQQKSTLEAIEKKLAFEVPALKDLSKDQLEKIAELVLIENFKDEMKQDVLLKKFDFNEMKRIFLNNRKSQGTKNIYEYTFNDFETYLKSISFDNPLKIQAATADDYIYSLIKSNKSASTVRRYAASLSSFYSFIERRTNGLIRNPFKGSKALPKPKTENKDKFFLLGVDNTVLEDTRKDFETIINEVENPALKAIIKIAIETGLRVGAFENMTIHGDRYKTTSKGKEIVGTLSQDILDFIEENGLNKKRPFSNFTDNRLKSLFKYHTYKLYAVGKIKSKYSFHDLRHFKALEYYTETKDIYSLSKILGHSSISITEKYLKGLKVAI